MNDSHQRGDTELLRSLVDHLPSMLAYWDRNLNCRFANRAYERWFGVDPDGLVGTSIRDLLGPELFAANERYMRRALAGEQQTFERIVPGPGGVRRHSLATYIPDVQNGEVAGFIAHVTEVTQLKLTEAALRDEIAMRERATSLLVASEHSLREAQRLGQIGSWTWEPATDITTWSEELYRLFGRDPQQLPPTFARHHELYTPASWARLKTAVDLALSAGKPYVLELEYRRADGTTGWLEARGECLRDDGGALSGLRGTVQEISQRRSSEEMRVQLQVSEAANRNKSSLLSRASHELRTPLNAILGFAQLLAAADGLQPLHKQWARKIVGSGRQMLGLVDELLDIALADSGMLPMHESVVDFTALCTEAIAHARRSTTVPLNGPDSSCRLLVRADAARLRQVIDCLISNAIKYGGENGIVGLSLRPVGDRVVLEVSDNGPGLTSEQLARLFQPFARLGAESGPIPGVGLGLTLTKSLVERMRGTVSVSSKPGVGSVFTVTLPAAPPPAP